jgi:hypothetical protein
MERERRFVVVLVWYVSAYRVRGVRDTQRTESRLETSTGLNGPVSRGPSPGRRVAHPSVVRVRCQTKGDRATRSPAVITSTRTSPPHAQRIDNRDQWLLPGSRKPMTKPHVGSREASETDVPPGCHARFCSGTSPPNTVGPTTMAGERADGLAMFGERSRGVRCAQMDSPSAG